MALDAEAEAKRNKIDPRYRADTDKRGELTSDFALTGNAYELLSQSLAANTSPDKDASIMLSASQQSQRHAQSHQAKKREERQQLQLTLAEQARQLSERLGREIAAMEMAFEAELGDAWREQIANKVMDADDIPQRRDGETMQTYRERLETVLIATMIDPATGNIKAEYANSDDADIRRYADWAQAQHTKRATDAYIEKRSDPSLTEAERQVLDADIAASSIGNEMRQIQASLAETGVRSAAYQDRDNADYDRVASSSDAEADAFSI